MTLHPLSIKAILKGHPYVTLDRFSAKFPKAPDSLFLLAPLHHGSNVLLLNDPHHPKIKARVWSFEENSLSSVKKFEQSLHLRLEQAIQKRTSLIKSHERENIYLIFGEADKLPGLFMQQLGKNYLLQFFCGFWKNIEHQLILFLRELLPFDYSIIIQERFNPKKIIIKFDSKKQNFNKHPIISEFGVKYQLNFEAIDVGLYTDAASIRKKIIPLIRKNSKVLNLFSYTGSFSLLAFNRQAKAALSYVVMR